MKNDITAATLCHLRQQSLLLGDKRLKSVKEVARWFCAMQSQDLASGKWSFGVRLPQKTEAHIDAAIESGDVLRTWPMRGTIHFIASEDARWLLQTTGTKALARAASRRAYLGLEESTANRASDILGKALRGGKRFTRTEAVACLKQNGIKAEGQLAYHLLWYASQIGVTCIGPNVGNEQTFVLLADWAKTQRTLVGDEALSELAVRYFRSHGPVTQQDFMGWSGLTAAEAKRGIALAGNLLVALTWQGKSLWMSKAIFDAAANAPARAQPRVHVLPGFDEFLLGIKDRSLAVPAAHKNKIIPGNNGMFLSTLVVDGVVVGTWKRTVKRTKGGDRVVIDPAPFTKLSRPIRTALDEAFDSYGKYLGMPVEVRWP